MGNKRQLDVEIIVPSGPVLGPAYWLSQANAHGVCGRVVRKPSDNARWRIWWARAAPTRPDVDWSLHDTGVWDALGWPWPWTNLTGPVGTVICDVSLISRSVSKSTRFWRHMRRVIGDQDVTLVTGSRHPPSSFEVFEQCAATPAKVTHFIHSPRADVLGHAAARCHAAGIDPFNVDAATIHDHKQRFLHTLTHIQTAFKTGKLFVNG